MAKQTEAVPGSKPKKHIKSQRLNNPTMVSHSVKLLFGLQEPNQSDFKPKKTAFRPMPFSIINPETRNNSKSQIGNYKNTNNNGLNQKPTNHKELEKPQSKGVNSMENNRSMSVPKSSAQKQVYYQQALDKAKEQFSAKKELGTLGMSPRNSLNELLYKERQVQKNPQIGQRRKSMSQLNTYNLLNFDAIKTKQHHGYNIISCLPSAYE